MINEISVIIMVMVKAKQVNVVNGFKIVPDRIWVDANTINKNMHKNTHVAVNCVCTAFVSSVAVV